MKGKSASKSWKKQSILDVSVALVVLFLPFISFVHLLIGEEGNQFNFFGLGFDHGFPDNQIFIWFLLLHFSSCIFTLLIFLFSLGYWRYFLLLPICYFIAYPLWMFVDQPGTFYNFLFNATGVLLAFMLISLVLLLDHFIKTKLVDKDIHLTFEDGCREFFEAWNSRCNREIRKTLKRKTDLTAKEYLYRIYYYSNLVDRIQGADSSAHVATSGPPNSYRNIAISSLLFALFAALFTHHWIPGNEAQTSVLGIQFGSFGFLDSSTFLFYASNKLILFALGLLWFVTCQYWWRWAILSPVLFYLYQFWEIFQPIKDINSSGNMNILPLVLLTVLVVVLLWGLIRRISVNRDYREFLKTELNTSLTQLSREENRNYLWQIQVNSPEVL